MALPKCMSGANKQQIPYGNDNKKNKSANTTYCPRIGTPPTAMLRAMRSFHSSGPVM
jgi:hypothetical protein